MKLKNLKMKPFNTSLMGVIKGVSDYYGYNYSDAFIFGATGQAFMINIHKKLCPSGPYCWNMTKFTELLRHMGIIMEDLGFFPPTIVKQARGKVEAIIRSKIDNRIPCSMLNLDNQLIYGYESEGLLCYQPWPKMKFPPAKLSYGTWEELGEDFHVNFYSFLKIEHIHIKKIILESIIYAIELFDSSESYSWEHYGMGFDAYDNFIDAVKKGYGDSHGNWWNAKVWSECRSMAKDYMNEISELYDLETKEFMQDIAYIYEQIGNYLDKISNRELDVLQKVKLLEKTRELEIENLNNLKELVIKL
ncbi:MAG: hypothetical protein JXR69_04345 [Candidatus Delongbacteria bacterium]|nr:hypothetical protein [Candidatus Delongbacteria bacterium]